MDSHRNFRHSTGYASSSSTRAIARRRRVGPTCSGQNRHRRPRAPKLMCSPRISNRSFGPVDAPRQRYRPLRMRPTSLACLRFPPCCPSAQSRPPPSRHHLLARARVGDLVSRRQSHRRHPALRSSLSRAPVSRRPVPPSTLRPSLVLRAPVPFPVCYDSPFSGVEPFRASAIVRCDSCINHAS